jgi:hypothetical protein
MVKTTHQSMMIMNGTWGTLQLPKKAGWVDALAVLQPQGRSGRSLFSFPRSEETCKDKKDNW